MPPARVRARQPRWAVNGLALAVVERAARRLRSARLGARRAPPPRAPRRCARRARRGRRRRPRRTGCSCDRDGRCATSWRRHGVLVRDCASFGLPRHVPRRPAPARAAQRGAHRVHRGRPVTRLAAVAAGIAVDRWCGEPPTAVHPVAWFGRGMGARRARAVARPSRRGRRPRRGRRRRRRGWPGCGLRRLLGDGPATLVATAVCVAGRMLDDEALAVGALLRSGDLPGARLRLRSLVGSRHVAALDERGRGACRGRVGRREHDRRGRRAGAVGGRARGARRPRPPGRQHARRDGRAPLGPLPPLRLGERPPRRRRQRRAGDRRRGARRRPPSRLAGGRSGVPSSSTPGTTRRRTPASSRGRSPPPSGSALGGANRYGDVVEDRGRLGAGRDPVAADIARAVRLRRAVGTGTAAVLVALEAQRALRKRPSRRSQLRLVSSSHPTASARRSVVAT